jgi:N-acetylglucosaminyldiphosphoundecaprenol N-acetyl-beta-D-mannosaminyltransferase
MNMKLLGVGYKNITVDVALLMILELLDRKKGSIICFLNADCLYKAQKDQEYKDILNCADLVLSDGIGLKLATKLFGGKMNDNCNGTDLSPLLMEKAAAKGWKVFFLGGKEGIADKAAENMRQRIPSIQIVGTHLGYFDDDRPVVDKIKMSGADILFVAMGAPLQEKWIFRNHERLNPCLCLGVGALLDYLSGSIPRAPLWMRKIYLEWFWRILVDPKRMFKRYIIDGVWFFIYLFYYRVRYGVSKSE